MNKKEYFNLILRFPKNLYVFKTSKKKMRIHQKQNSLIHLMDIKFMYQEFLFLLQVYAKKVKLFSQKSHVFCF